MTTKKTLTLCLIWCFFTSMLTSQALALQTQGNTQNVIDGQPNEQLLLLLADLDGGQTHAMDKTIEYLGDELINSYVPGGCFVSLILIFATLKALMANVGDIQTFYAIFLFYVTIISPFINIFLCPPV
jgi:hypothetical protein